jgi:hypothetical protein
MDGDLFKYTRKIKHMYFYIPGLRTVGSNLLIGLDDLVYLYFHSSGCFGSFEAKTPQMIQELKKKLLLQCPSLEEKTTTLPSTTTLSTSTTTQCSVRCSLDSEF